VEDLRTWVLAESEDHWIPRLAVAAPMPNRESSLSAGRPFGTNRTGHKFKGELRR
jgi:hypothetical protein